MESTNSEKAKAGVNTANELLKLLKKLTKKYENVSFRVPIEYGEKNKDQKQFKANARIDFNEENLSWLVDTSSSFRSDRIKGKEFDIEHIKKILEDMGINSKAYFVLPDNACEKDKKELLKFGMHIKKKDRVTYFDGAMLMNSFRNLLEHKITGNMQQGIRDNILRKSGEEILYTAFNNEKNLEIWNNPENKTIKSSNYKIFSDVLKKLCPSIGKLSSVTAFGSNKNEKNKISQDLRIVRTKNNKVHGKPKTDVVISLINMKNENFIFKLSVKQPSVKKGKVTVHEGYVEQLLSDLKLTLPKTSKFVDKALFDKLSMALLNFQINGSKKKMDKEKLAFLDNNLDDLNKWLVDYFIFGINNSYLNKNQQANALLIFDPTTGNCEVNTVKEVEKKLLYGRKATFGTPFGWTYPSGQGGKKIQIKGPIN